MRERHRFDLEKLRIDIDAGLRPLRITTHAQQRMSPTVVYGWKIGVESLKDDAMFRMSCPF